MPDVLDQFKSAANFYKFKVFVHAQAEKYQAKSFRNNTNLTTTSTIMDKIFETKFRLHVKYCNALRQKLNFYFSVIFC